MEWLQALRYAIAVLVVAIIPLVLAYWYTIHSLAGLWRKLGVATTLAIAGSLCLVAFATAIYLHSRYMGTLWPFQWWLAAIGAVVLVVAVRIEKQCQRQLALSVMVGIPEFDSGKQTQLLTEGIYGRTRNPRYLAILVGMLGLALVVNVRAAYLAWGLFVPGVYLLILLEERELRQRFGNPYLLYLAAVPRLVPKRRKTI